MRIKAKTIRIQGASFIGRLSFYFKNGSLKIHVILSDDTNDVCHTHPWDFKSFILFGGYYETNGTTWKKYSMFSVNRKLHTDKHRVRLTKVLGIKIPCFTIGWYSHKIQLCSFCEKLGYCKENPTAKIHSMDKPHRLPQDTIRQRIHRRSKTKTNV